MHNVESSPRVADPGLQVISLPAPVSHAQKRPQRLSRSRLAALQGASITALGSCIAYLGLGAPPLIGVDDANITQTYARNLAEGLGYVYTPGGERVEGSTSLLWTLLNVAAFLFSGPTPGASTAVASSAPEYVLLSMCVVFCCASVMASLLLADRLALELGVDRTRTNLVCVVSYLATPSFFAWNTWTLMDVAVWSPVFLWTLLLLCERLAADYRPSLHSNLGLVVVSVLSVLARPEGGLICLSLLACTALLAAWQQRLRMHRKMLILAACIIVVVTLQVSAWRVAYFGHPVPNTYYAKVSSHALDQLVSGTRYLASFFGKTPHASLYLAAWLGLLAWLWAQRRTSPAFGSLPSTRSHGLAVALMMCAGCVSVWLLYAGLGGDHFPMHRFYQPVVLLLPVALAVAVAAGSRAIARRLTPYLRLRPWAIACALVAMGVGSVDFFSKAPLLRREIDFALDGRRIASMLSTSSDVPSVGVIAAGGLARLYRGQIYDLMGLNWVAMAHADPTKSGAIRNHGGFDAATFYRALPELITLVGDRCVAGRAFELDSFEKQALKGIDDTPRFRDLYEPAALGHYLVFVRKDRRDSLSRNPHLRLSTDRHLICESRPGAG